MRLLHVPSWVRNLSFGLHRLGALALTQLLKVFPKSNEKNYLKKIIETHIGVVQEKNMKMTMI